MNFATVTYFRLHEIVVEFAAERRELVAAMQHIFRPFVAGDDEDAAGGSVARDRPSSHRWRAAVDGQQYCFDDFEEALWSLEDTVAVRLLKAASDCLLIHSAAVADGDRIVLLVGPSGSGKTTTALELVRRGWLYITDEFTAVEPSAEAIRPFPRSATRKFNGVTPAGTNFEVNGESGFRSHLLPDHRSLLEPLAMKSTVILFPQYRRRRSPMLRAMNSAEACTRVMPSIFNFVGHERRVWPTLARLTAKSRVYEFHYSSAGTDLDMVTDLFVSARV